MWCNYWRNLPCDSTWWPRSDPTLVRVMVCCPTGLNYYLNQRCLASLRSSDIHLNLAWKLLTSNFIPIYQVPMSLRLPLSRSPSAHHGRGYSISGWGSSSIVKKYFLANLAAPAFINVCLYQIKAALFDTEKQTVGFKLDIRLRGKCNTSSWERRSFRMKNRFVDNQAVSISIQVRLYQIKVTLIIM